MRRPFLIAAALATALIVAACSGAPLATGPDAHPSASPGIMASFSRQPSSPRPPSSSPIDPQDPDKGGAHHRNQGIFKLDHLVFIVMENRSFDHYFGTYPGADGIPKKVCIPDPGHPCATPYHNRELLNMGGMHNNEASDTDINGGKMDGFAIMGALTPENVTCYRDRTSDECEGFFGPKDQPDVMGYHTRKEIPNYWEYADHFVLHDRMFAPVDSWTHPAHLFLVSAWSATCESTDPMSCVNDSEQLQGGVKWDDVGGLPTPYAWTDITYLLHKYDVTWRWYNAEDTCIEMPCTKEQQRKATTISANPLPGFVTVHENKQMKNLLTHKDLYRDAAKGDLPSVAWVMPSRPESDHPGSEAPVTKAQAFVTRVVNAIMESPDWESSAIFITWDDWGGFYDHVEPPRVDENGYGIRVPSLLISPYAKEGYIDSQTLSFDAYLKLIEDRFLDGQRLNPKTDGRPDKRPTVREKVDRLGDLAEGFDFDQEPRPPLILKPWPG